MFLYHGAKDTGFAMDAAKRSYNYFEHLYNDNKNLLKITYDQTLEFGVNHKELAMLGDWLKEIFHTSILPNYWINSNLSMLEKFNRVSTQIYDNLLIQKKEANKLFIQKKYEEAINKYFTLIEYIEPIINDEDIAKEASWDYNGCVNI